MRKLFILLATGIVLLCSGGGAWWWLFSRSPQEQVLARQSAFLTAVEERDWEKVRSMLTDDYMDDYGHDRDSAVEDASLVLRSFFQLSLSPQLIKVQAVPDLGMVVMKIRMEGRGAGLSESIEAQVNGLQEPWFFHWHKKGRWPWDWRIVQIHNDGLQWLNPSGL